MDRLAGSLYGMYLAESTITTPSPQSKIFQIVIESLMETRGFSAKDQMNRTLVWENEGGAVDSSTEEALERYRRHGQDAKPLQGSKDPLKASVTPLIRVLALLLYYGQDHERMDQMIDFTCKTTHRQQECIDACHIWHKVLLDVINQDDDDINLELCDDSPFLKELELLYRAFSVNVETSNFYAGLQYLIRNIKMRDLGYVKNQLVVLYGQLAGAYWGLTGFDENDLFSLPNRQHLSSMMENILKI